MSTILFDPARMPARDEDGWVFHPDLWLRCWYDGAPEDEAQIAAVSLHAMGLDISYLPRSDDRLAIIVPGDEDQFDGLYDAGGGCTAWNPPVPEPIDGRAWRLAAIYDVEDLGPVAAFVRDLCASPTLLPVVSCRKCGCTEARACPGGCNWAEPDLCSSCMSA